MAGVWDVLSLTVEAAMAPSTAGVYDTARYGQSVYGPHPELPWLDITCDVIGLEILRTGSRDPVLTFRPETGTLAITLFDQTGRYDPNNPEGPHYQLLMPRLPLRISLAGNRIATAYANSISHDPAADRTVILASDGISLLASVTAHQVRHEENSKDRMTMLHIRGAADSPLAPPLSTTGVGTTLKSATMDGDIWSMMLATAQADRGLLWLTGGGVLKYDADWDRVAGVPVASFGCQHQTAVDAHAWTWSTTVDDDLLTNTVEAKSVGIDGQVDQTGMATDTDSVTRFGASSAGGEVVLPLPVAGLQDWADDAVRAGAWPWPRTSTLGVTLWGSEPAAANELAVWFALDLADEITWVGHDRDPEKLQITGIRHQITDQGQYVGELTLGKPRAGSGYNNAGVRYNQVAYA